MLHDLSQCNDFTLNCILATYSSFVVHKPIFTVKAHYTHQLVSLLSLRTSSYFSAIAGSLTSFDILIWVSWNKMVMYEQFAARGSSTAGRLIRLVSQADVIYLRLTRSCFINRRPGRAVMAVSDHPNLLTGSF